MGTDQEPLLSYHFIGLGGIGMSALARVLLQRGARVRGSDKNASALLEELRREGAQILIGHNPAVLQQGDTVVYGSSIGTQHVERKRADELRLPLLHRSELLHQLIGIQKPLLVTGTHGKTTTTALLTAVLLEAHLDPTYFIGGILRREKTNGRSGHGPYCVAEADESDGSFLKTPAYGAIITNVGRDHLDYWHTEERLHQAFVIFSQQVLHPDLLFWCGDDPVLNRLDLPGVSYGFSVSTTLRISNYQQYDQGISFDVGSYRAIQLSLLGKHNALNGAAVFALALALGIPEATIRTAFATFQGTHRRLEWIGTSSHKVDIYDDYGHHPTEIAATLATVRAHIRERRLVVLFQPHRFSRLADLWEQYVFPEADLLVITDIYSAGENPLPGIEGAALAHKLNALYAPRSNLEQHVSPLLRFGDVVLTLGAGDITDVGRALLSLKIKSCTVGILFGGTSPEHPISVRSAQNILSTLNPLHSVKRFFIRQDGSWDYPMEELRQCDICIPVLHGPQGEDGMMAALLETMNIAYVGCGYASAALCMQKAWTKQVVEAHGIRIVPFIEWNGHASVVRDYPAWVKAAHLGSSIGVYRVTNEEELLRAVQLVLQLDDRVIVEREVRGREIEFAVLGNEWIRVGAPGEIMSEGAFYDFEKKYGPQASRVQAPAPLTAQQMAIGKDLAIRAYRACGCQGLARVDFFLDEQGEFLLNEINPFPGFTRTSAYPKMWEAEGVCQTDLLDELMILALHRYRKKKRYL